ncbi:PEGA domain-containing protein [Polyangium mundeleinium]|uniref:PEGA domain-containing protein n=1 Tax=Polyangium mundeleinium TaxID=2995306 RepID=A0ABT5EVD1_9BACT|nr:PEGA domain-containing protein [Polyangium mundeleinium]MDC0745778.1 PEGA domain-containing protein [Polyangium mundeleinium]
MRSSILIAVPCALSLALVAPAALAAGPKKQPTKEEMQEAQRRYQRGRELYEDNDFTAALVEIRRAYELAPSYKLLFDIGQICYQLPDYPCALRSFKQYLDEGASEINPQRRAEVENDVRKLEGRVATLKITTSRPGADILVDDVVVGKTPLDVPVLVGAGKRKVTARVQGAEPVTRVIEVAGTDVVDVALDVGAGSTAIPPSSGDGTSVPGSGPPGEDKGAGRNVPVVPWVITGALAVGTGIVGGLAFRASSNYRSQLDTFGTTRPTLDESYGSMKNLAIATDVLLGATAVAGVTSLILTLTAGPKGPAKAALAPVHAGVGPGSVWIKGTF